MPELIDQPPSFVYGTSGFRAEAIKLHEVVRRTAFYAAVRANALQKSVGLMITASHNPAQDNGIKLIEPNGQMLPVECEEQLTRIVNGSEEAFCKYREEIRKQSRPPSGKSTLVLIGTDTRPSSYDLFLRAFDGVEMFGGGVRAEFYEHHTTPQLHFIVRSVNNPNVSGHYVSQFREAFADSFELIPFREDRASHYTNQLFVDCANGVGALWVANYCGNDAQEGVIPLQLTLLNTQTNNGELLNNECGADFMKIQARIPANFDKIPAGSRCVSLDGDADRLVYFYPNGAGQGISLLDGDHISALFAKFIKEQFDEAKRLGSPIPLTFGIVQTAYANGNSTRYFTYELDLKPALTKTGVKHLEESARKFDVGVYFEANGHGTVCFSDKFHSFLKSYVQMKKPEQPRHIRLLAIFARLVNEVVGDGIADLMAVECLLRHFNWSIQDWECKTYRNMPNVQLKVPVKERSNFATAEDNETQLIRPEGKQAEIDKIVGEFAGARAFVRPSGTEQIVRIYAEAQSQEEAHKLAKRLAELVVELK